MKSANIYQTLEDRNNYEYVKKHGPFFCHERYSNGNLKKGIKEPWLGPGYYFWDTRIEDAHWWGKTVYNGKYYICCTTYDQHSELLYDMVGDLEQFDDFVKCANYIKHQKISLKISFPIVLSYLKEHANFNYKAIRVWPYPKNIKETAIKFPDRNIVLGKADKIQVCFFDKTLLTAPCSIVPKHVFASNQTI